MWIQVPQWEVDWSKCAVDVPDLSCQWYVAAPDNTFGEGFNWENALWFDAYGLQDVAKTEKESVVKKLQNNKSFYFINKLLKIFKSNCLRVKV